LVVAGAVSVAKSSWRRWRWASARASASEAVEAVMMISGSRRLVGMMCADFKPSVAAASSAGGRVREICRRWRWPGLPFDFDNALPSGSRDLDWPGNQKRTFTDADQALEP